MKHRLFTISALASVLIASPLYALQSAQENISENSQNNAEEKDWTKVFSMSKFGGFVMGNPEAETRIAEYVSYTCSHCATFERDSAPILKKDHITKGTVSLEIRNYIRDPIDLTIATLARCGGTDKFFSNHAMFMREQTNILQRARFLSPDVIQDWNTNSMSEYIAAATKTMGLDTLMIAQGFTAEQIDNCIADTQSQQFITQMTLHASMLQRVRGTPGFAINDEYLPAIGGLQTLLPYL